MVANEGGLFEFVRTPAATVEQALHDTVGENTRAFAHELGVAMTWDTLRVEDLAALDDINNAGGRAFGQTHSRGVSVLSTFRLRLPFDGLPEWQDVRSLDLEHQRRIYEDPEARRRLVDAAMHGTYGKAVGSEHPPPDFGRMMIMDSVTPPYKSVAEVAKERGIEPADAIIALGLETNFDQLFWQQLSPLVSEDEILTMMKHPRTVMALSDAGAHLGQISDYSIQTYLLDYWVREREEFTLEEAVHMLTKIPARHLGVQRPGSSPRGKRGRPQRLRSGDRGSGSTDGHRRLSGWREAIPPDGHGFLGHHRVGGGHLGQRRANWCPSGKAVPRSLCPGRLNDPSIFSSWLFAVRNAVQHLHWLQNHRGEKRDALKF